MHENLSPTERWNWKHQKTSPQKFSSPHPIAWILIKIFYIQTELSIHPWLIKMKENPPKQYCRTAENRTWKYDRKSEPPKNSIKKCEHRQTGGGNDEKNSQRRKDESTRKKIIDDNSTNIFNIYNIVIFSVRSFIMNTRGWNSRMLFFCHLFSSLLLSRSSSAWNFPPHSSGEKSSSHVKRRNETNLLLPSTRWECRKRSRLSRIIVSLFAFSRRKIEGWFAGVSSCWDENSSRKSVRIVPLH